MTDRHIETTPNRTTHCTEYTLYHVRISHDARLRVIRISVYILTQRMDRVNPLITVGARQIIHIVMDYWCLTTDPRVTTVAVTGCGGDELMAAAVATGVRRRYRTPPIPLFTLFHLRSSSSSSPPWPSSPCSISAAHYIRSCRAVTRT